MRPRPLPRALGQGCGPVLRSREQRAPARLRGSPTGCARRVLRPGLRSRRRRGPATRTGRVVHVRAPFIPRRHGVAAVGRAEAGEGVEPRGACSGEPVAHVRDRFVRGGVLVDQGRAVRAIGRSSIVATSSASALLDEERGRPFSWRPRQILSAETSGNFDRGGSSGAPRWWLWPRGRHGAAAPR